MEKIAIRVDGNEIIATGHIMRCLSIAQQIRKMNTEIVFVVADERSCPIIEENGFDTYVLNTVWNDMDTETERFCKYIVSNDIRIVLLDSYFVTEDYLSNISKSAKICYIDDLDKFLYPVHTIVNYGLQYDRNYENRYKKAGLDTNFLLGCDYIPLREEFSYEPYSLKEKVARVLITTGGTDQLSMTYSLLEEFFTDCRLMELEYNVIVGRFNKDKEKIKALAARYTNVVLHENVNNISYWMRNCDVAISAAGTTKYELSACGTPSICFEVADNQEGAEDWEKKGYMLYAGNAYKKKDKCLRKCQKQLICLCDNYQLRKRMSGKMQELVDGLGAERIAKYLLKM